MVAYWLHMIHKFPSHVHRPWDISDPGTQEGLDVGGALGEGRAVDLCQTAKRSAGYHWLRHPCSPLTKTRGAKIEAATATVTAPVG